jgi:hypothetical protein
MTKFVVCIDNQEYPASLERGKLYPVLTNGSDKHGMIRVVDESGEDYLYPTEMFASIAVPEAIALKLAA